MPACVEDLLSFVECSAFLFHRLIIDGASSNNIHVKYFTQETTKLPKPLYQLFHRERERNFNILKPLTKPVPSKEHQCYTWCEQNFINWNLIIIFISWSAAPSEYGNNLNWKGWPDQAIFFQFHSNCSNRITNHSKLTQLTANKQSFLVIHFDQSIGSGQHPCSKQHYI